MNTSPDTYVVEPTGSFINTRHGAQREFVLKRNGTPLFRSTADDCERERKLRLKSTRNPLAQINGELK